MTFSVASFLSRPLDTRPGLEPGHLARELLFRLALDRTSLFLFVLSVMGPLRRTCRSARADLSIRPAGHVRSSGQVRSAGRVRNSGHVRSSGLVLEQIRRDPVHLDAVLPTRVLDKPQPAELGQPFRNPARGQPRDPRQFFTARPSGPLRRPELANGEKDLDRVTRSAAKPRARAGRIPPETNHYAGRMQTARRRKKAQKASSAAGIGFGCSSRIASSRAPE
jgi:hypothetical protein